MPKLRIESNPYEQTIKYSIFDDNKSIFLPINNDDSSSSNLLNIDDFSKCFFPFKASSILAQLVKDYAINDELDIIFEGPSDELKELENIQSINPKFEKVRIFSGEKYLEDGRDVIRHINEIFASVEPIVRDSVQNNDSIDKNLQKFSDAAKDIIPICVIGNTNMGKSTFINALLGAEYLPQDKERCTAKVYKITESKQQDRALISFNFEKESITIEFKDSILFNGNITDEFKNDINKSLKESNADDLSKKINCVLKYLNKYDETYNTKNISDLIDIEVPFNSDVFQKSNNPFVIFDTPGSNYSGNSEDSELLKHQMKDLTNGLPIFIANYDGLSSTDNEVLIKELQSIEELDQRFTILIINKSDEGKLDANKWDSSEEDRIKSLEVPKKLSSKGLQGIYFVSSLMGLGFKNKGNFIDKKVEKNFNIYRNYFDGSDSDYTLYKFNILPPQLKSQFEDDITDDINQIYLNSGLYSIEKEIETYANKYSAYNKCQQSKIFLNNVFKETSNEIEKQNREIVENTNKIDEYFKKKKETLCEDILKDSDYKKKQYEALRIEQISQINFEKEYFSTEELQKIENEIFTRHNKEQNVDTLDTELKISQKQSISNFGKNISSIGSNIAKNVKDKNFSGLGKDFINDIKNTSSELSSDLGQIKLENKNLRESLKRSKEETYKEAMTTFEEAYEKTASEHRDSINKESINYWLSKSEELKNSLIDIVQDAEELSENQKDDIEKIIKEYQQIDLNKKDIDALSTNNYKSFFSNRIVISRLKESLNRLMNESIRNLYTDTMKEHRDTFESWTDELLKKIIENIGEMNPQLKSYLERKTILANRKRELEDNKEKLEYYTSIIEQMISWKED